MGCGVTFPCEETKYAYLAAAIDTEGCIGIERTHRLNGKIAYVPYIIISNTNEDWIIFLKNQFGGGFHAKHKNNGWGCKPISDWKIRANKMREILPKIMPYLFIKRKQAEIVLKALEIIRDNWGNHRRYEQNLPKLESLWQECKKLNKRGM